MGENPIKTFVSPSTSGLCPLLLGTSMYHTDTGYNTAACMVCYTKLMLLASLNLLSVNECDVYGKKINTTIDNSWIDFGVDTAIDEDSDKAKAIRTLLNTAAKDRPVVFVNHKFDEKSTVGSKNKPKTTHVETSGPRTKLKYRKGRCGFPVSDHVISLACLLCWGMSCIFLKLLFNK